MFILKCIVDKYCSHKDGRVFACFVDLRKAFDTVIHTGLKLKLLEIGVGTNFYNVIKTCNMSRNIASKTVAPLALNSLRVNWKLKQGDNLSPFF
jgi:hypothetical protein